MAPPAPRPPLTQPKPACSGLGANARLVAHRRPTSPTPTQSLPVSWTGAETQFSYCSLTWRLGEGAHAHKTSLEKISAVISQQ